MKDGRMELGGEARPILDLEPRHLEDNPAGERRKRGESPGTRRELTHEGRTGKCTEDPEPAGAHKGARPSGGFPQGGPQLPGRGRDQGAGRGQTAARPARSTCPRRSPRLLETAGRTAWRSALNASPSAEQAGRAGSNAAATYLRG